MTAYYNEIDPYAAAWLRNLIAAGHIAAGEVDERSIVDVRPDDLRGFGQCHFFAGIGGWSYALRLAGIPDDLPIWSGSCPCQPFSVAGAKRGCEDERHLWPAFFNLIRECRPATVFGEQVAGAAGFAWYDLVAADLEGEDYAAAAADIGAHSVGAPHIRQRLYWVAHSNEGERGSWRPSPEQQNRSQLESARRSSSSIVAYSKSRGLGQGSPDVSRGDEGTRAQGSGMRFTNDGGSILGNACGEGLERREQRGARDNERHRTHAHGPTTESGSALDPWSDIEWIHCSDGKARPTKPGIFPLLFDGVSGRVAVGSAIQQTYRTLSEEEAAHLFNRVGVLRGSGNAIVPQLAAVFVRAAFGYTE